MKQSGHHKFERTIPTAKNRQSINHTRNRVHAHILTIGVYMFVYRASKVEHKRQQILNLSNEGYLQRQQ